MTYEQRGLLFNALIAPAKEMGLPIVDDYADMVNKDLDRIEPLIDVMLQEARNTPTSHSSASEIVAPAPSEEPQSNHEAVQDAITGG